MDGRGCGGPRVERVQGVEGLGCGGHRVGRVQGVEDLGWGGSRVGRVQGVEGSSKHVFSFLTCDKETRGIS